MATMNPTWNQPTAAEEGIKPAALPMDISQEQMKIARKQKLIDALSAQALQYRGNTEMAGNQAIQRSPLEAIAQTLTGGILGYADDRLDKQSAALPQKLADLNQSEMEKYLQMSQGETARPETQLPEGMTGPQERSLPGDRRGALVQALAGKSPVMQSFAQQELKNDAAMQRMLGEKAAGNATKASTVAAAQGQGLGALQAAAPELKTLDPKQIAFNPETGERSNVLDGSVTQGERKDGGTYNKLPSGMEVTAESMKVSANANARADAKEKGDIKLFEEAARGTWGAFQKGYENSQKAMKTYDVLDKQEQALNEGARTGIAQPMTDVLAQVGAAVGVPVDVNKLAKGSQYQSAFATEIADYLTAGAGVGRSLTDSDRKKLEQQYAQQWMTPEGQRAVIADLKARARGQVDLYKNYMGNMEEEFPDVARMARVSMAPGALPQAASTAASAPTPGTSKVKSWKEF